MDTRPLGALSQFVVEEMPRLIANKDYHGSFLWRLDELSSYVEDRDVQRLKGTAGWRIARLELAMLDAAICCLKLQHPRRFSWLMDKFYGPNELRVLTYEQLVLDNPLDDMRTFTGGEIGTTERNFYTAHRLIEDELSLIIENVRTYMTYLEGKGDGAGVWAPHELGRRLHAIVESFQGLGLKNMPVDPTRHFYEFRTYLEENKDRGTKGPSGAYSAQVPILEVLLRNGPPSDPKFRGWLKGHWEYFPDQHRDALHVAMTDADQGRTLVELLQSERANEDTAEYVYVLERFYYDFRDMHLSTLDVQMPDKVTGTGGTSARPFLNQRLGSLPVRRSLRAE